LYQQNPKNILSWNAGDNTMRQLFGIKIANFADDFRRASLEQKLKMVEKPALHFNKRIENSYFAACVEYLCLESHIPMPGWIHKKQYFLKEPFFAGGLESLKAFLLVESPLPFRRRNIFVSENALERA
jgi:hypothetical protein